MPRGSCLFINWKLQKRSCFIDLANTICLFLLLSFPLLPPPSPPSPPLQVEESMENLMTVISERNAALSELEAGRSDGPRVSWKYDPLGRAVRHLTSEHTRPPHLDAEFVDSRDRRMIGPNHVELLRLERERLVRRASFVKRDRAVRRWRSRVRQETLSNSQE